MAANLSFLGWDTRVAGRIGADRAGDALVANLKTAGCRTHELEQAADVQTPLVLHQITMTGHNFRFSLPLMWPAVPQVQAMQASRVPEITRTRVTTSVFFDRPSVAAVTIARRFRDASRTVVFEPSSRGHASLFNEALELAHVVKYSQERQKHSRIDQSD